MSKAILILSCRARADADGAAVAQDDQATKPDAATEQLPDVAEDPPRSRRPTSRTRRFVRTLTNVQVELTLTDQAGTQAPEKKTVSMIVVERQLGQDSHRRQRAPQSDAPFMVDLNVDARPFVSVDGPIQLELTLVLQPAWRSRQGHPEAAPDRHQPEPDRRPAKRQAADHLAGGRSGQRPQGHRRSEGHHPEVAISNAHGCMRAIARTCPSLAMTTHQLQPV